MPMVSTATPAAWARAVTASTWSAATDSTMRDVDSEKHATASPIATSKPTSPLIAISASAIASPPSEQSWTPDGMRSVTNSATSRGAGRDREIRGRRGPVAQPVLRRPHGAAELGTRGAEHDHGVTAFEHRGGRTSTSSSIKPMTPTTGVGSMSAPRLSL